MDVTLVLTHRCNLACDYCYAGEHFRKEMDDATMDAAIELLFVDDEPSVQLAFFGGEPFLAFAAMQRAVTVAQARAKALGRQLRLQCTTNGTLIGAAQVAWIRQVGMKVTLSIDGVQEAHDMSRRLAGGGSSFDMVERGLRALVDGGTEPDALMVITPATAPFLFRSTRWLWSEGLTRVRTNLDFGARWNLRERDVLREELIAVGRDLLWRRLRGERVELEPFAAALTGDAVPTACGDRGRKRGQVVVATHGDLYPCAPLVGEDRATGPEAAQRIGHLQDGHAAILARVTAEGIGCGDGKGACACASYLETGDRDAPGPNAAWFGSVAYEVGRAVARALAEAREGRLVGVPPMRGGAPRSTPEVVPPPPPDRRGMLRMVILGAGGLMLAGGIQLGIMAARPHEQPAGALLANPNPVPPPEPPPVPPPQSPLPPPEPQIMPPGAMPAPPPPEHKAKPVHKNKVHKEPPAEVPKTAGLMLLVAPKA